MKYIQLIVENERHLEILTRSKKVGLPSMSAYLLACEEYFAANAPQKTTFYGKGEAELKAPEQIRENKELNAAIGIPMETPKKPIESGHSPSCPCYSCNPKK